MEEEGIDPFSVNRNPKIIKAAQEQIATMDVLVCGVCHAVFHFIEEFQEHKSKNECGLPAFKGNITETKPQVWAFLLWKSSRAKTESEGADQVSSWKLYQKWCKMPENIRESWVCAGKAIQVSTTLASAKMQEVKTVGKVHMLNKTKSGNEKDIKGNLGNDVKKEGVVRKLTNIRGKPGRPPQGQDEKPKESSDSSQEKKEDKDGTVSVENGGGDLLSDTVEIKEEQVSEADVEDHATFEEDDEEEELRRTRLEQGESIEDIDKTANRQPANQPKKSQEMTDESGNVVRRKGKDGEKGSESEDEYVVERIVSRRYNIRKRAYEYLLKWEGYPDDQNTWEPAENLADCKHLLENFERNLAKQKAQQQQRGPSGLPGGPKMIIATPEHRKDLLSPRSVGRPVRSSKKKALDQVKAWCGSMYTKKLEDEDRQGSSDGSEDEFGVRKIKSLSESEDASQHADGNLSSDDLSGRKRKKEDDDPYKKGPGRPRKIIKVNGMPTAPGKTIVASSNQELAKAIGEFITGFDGTTDKKSPIILGKKEPGGNITLTTGQQPVLVANSKGVVKVDARSMPNLASGVYIMSKSSSGAPSTGLIKVDSPAVSSPATPNVKVVTGGQKQGGILAMKDAKAGGTVGSPTSTSPPLASSPPKTILGPKKPTVLGSTGSPVTPMKLLPKLVSPQIRGGGLVRVGQATRPNQSTLAPRPGAKLPLNPRPSLVSPQTPSAGKGIRPLMPKQTYSVSGGKVSSLPLTAGMKSGIRPIEAMLGGTSSNQSAPSTPTQRTILGKKVTPAVSIVVKDTEAAEGNKMSKESSALTPVRGAAANRGRAKGGRISVGENKAEDKAKLISGDGLHMEFTEEKHSDAESESDCGLPDDFPTGDLPPLEPASPPRPLTLCPLTGKILARAEGEKTPPPSPPPAAPTTPQPEAILPDEGDGEGEETLIKVEMSPGGTTGTVVSESGPLLRSEAGLTVKRLLAGGGQGNANLLSTISQLGGQVQGISLPARKLLTEDGTELVESETEMVTIQGEDGVVYQVQGELEDGTQTLLVQGEDGEQRCVYVTTNEGVEGEDGSTVLAFGDPAYADAVAHLDPSQVSALTEGGSQILLQGEDGTTFSETQLMSVMEGDKDDGQAQIVAQVLEAGQPQPGGGPRKVVLLLPDGNMMMTEVDEEQYAALELDK